MDTLSFAKLALGQPLPCDYCRLLDFEAIFYGKEAYELPPTPSNFLGECNLFPNTFCTFLGRLRSHSSACQFCRILLSVLEADPAFNGTNHSTIFIRRGSIFSKEKEVTLPGFHYLTVEASEDGGTKVDFDSKIAICAVGNRKIKLQNSRDECLRHFYPYLPKGMTPMYQTEEQTQQFDSWREATGSEYCLTVRSVEETNLDLSMIKRWLSTCNIEHQTWCKSMPSPPKGFRVVDVETDCLVDAPPDCQYLALSYVWGKAPPLLMSSTFSEFRRAGAFAGKAAEIPHTILDAITLCKQLGQQYLWVDSVCIIQDSAEDKRVQLAMMDRIYRCATLTIVAAAGNGADAGVPGVRASVPRIPAPQTTIDGIKMIAFPNIGEDIINKSAWNTRAWTFQERILSKRMLIFTEQSVSFECQEACWREEIEIAGPGSDTFRMDNADRQYQEIRSNFDQIANDPDLNLETMLPRERYTNVINTILNDCYAPLVRDFTKRNLTYQGDILNAFLGIQTVLNKSIGDFHWGLPQCKFAQSLAWTATSDTARMRVVEGGSGFPTWSWAGWIFPGDENSATYHTPFRGPYPLFQAYSDRGKQLNWEDDAELFTYMGLWPWHDGLLYPRTVEQAKEADKLMTETVERVWNDQLGPQLSEYVFFYTSVVLLHDLLQKQAVSENGENDSTQSGIETSSASEWYESSASVQLDLDVLRRADDGEGILTNGSLTHPELDFILKNPSEVHLIYLGSNRLRSGHFVMIAVRQVRGISMRFMPHLLFGMSAEAWQAAEPRRELVVLA